MSRPGATVRRITDGDPRSEPRLNTLMSHDALLQRKRRSPDIRSGMTRGDHGIAGA